MKSPSRPRLALVAPPEPDPVTARVVERTELPTRFGTFTAVGFLNTRDRGEHVALVRGAVEGAEEVHRVNSECLTGDALGSLRCDCRDQLELALGRLAIEERWILLYLRQEGRGDRAPEQASRVRAAGRRPRHGRREPRARLSRRRRDYAAASAMLRALGVRSVRLLTNNPTNLVDLERHGVPVAARILHAAEPNALVLDLTAELSRRRRFRALARRLTVPSTAPRYLPHALSTFSRRAANESTPPVVARWGFRMNMPESSFRQFLAKHHGQRGLRRVLLAAPPQAHRPELEAEASMVIIGGAAIALEYTNRHLTRDLDTSAAVQGALLDAVERARQAIQAEVDLEEPPPVGATGVFDAPEGYEERCRYPPGGPAPPPRYVPERHDLALMKAARGDERDLAALAAMHRRKPFRLKTLLGRYDEMARMVTSRGVRQRRSPIDGEDVR